MHARLIGLRATALMATLAIILGACSGASTSVAPTAASAATTSAPESAAAPESSAPAASAPAASLPSGAGVTLQVWGPPDLSPEMSTALADYATKTGVKMDITAFPNPFEQNLLARWAAGDRPDLLFFHGAGNWLVQLNPAANLLPMTGQPFVSRTLPGLIDATTAYQGVPYGAIVKSPFGYGVYYNKKVFADAGLSEPPAGGYQSLADLCTAIKASAPGIAPIYMGGGDQWPLQPLIVGLWADDITPDVARLLNTRQITFTDPRFVDWIQKEKDLQKQGCLNKDILTATYDNERASLFNGKAAMVYQGSWFYDGIVGDQTSDKVESEIGWFPLSGKSQIVSWEIPAGGTMYVPKTGDDTKQALAVGFLDYITSDGYDKFRAATNDYPVIQGFAKPTNAPPLRNKIYEWYLKTGQPIFQQVITAAYGPMEAFFQAQIAGTKTALQVGQALQDEFDRSAKQVGLPGF